LEVSDLSPARTTVVILTIVAVVLYTAVGGLKATFLTDFLHTTIALILIIYFTLSVLTSEQIGGLYGLYDKVQARSADLYIDGNFDGSLLTFKSKGAILFGVSLKMGNLALVVMVSHPVESQLPHTDSERFRILLFGRSLSRLRSSQLSRGITLLHLRYMPSPGGWDPLLA
jgi:Na+/proline symporter